MIHKPLLVVAVVLCNVSAGFAQSTGYPTKPIRMIVPFPPGGGNDILARTVGQRLSEVVNQQIIVDNRGGAGARSVRRLQSMLRPTATRYFSAASATWRKIPCCRRSPHTIRCVTLRR